MSKFRVGYRFRGPPGSGNGGYVAGQIARELGGSDWIVTLRRPTPLDKDLDLRREGEEASLFDGHDLIASAHRGDVRVDAPSPPSLAEAEAASRRFSGFHRHPVPECFVCGTCRAKGDGLRIFPGPLGGERGVAAPWRAADSLADGDGNIAIEFVWAGLDCAGFFAIEDRVKLAILGRIGVHLITPAPIECTLIVSGWAAHSDGRKHNVGTALHDQAGKLFAVAESTWIALQG